MRVRTERLLCCALLVETGNTLKMDRHKDDVIYTWIVPKDLRNGPLLFLISLFSVLIWQSKPQHLCRVNSCKNSK